MEGTADVINNNDDYYLYNNGVYSPLLSSTWNFMRDTRTNTYVNYNNNNIFMYSQADRGTTMQMNNRLDNPKEIPLQKYKWVNVKVTIAEVWSKISATLSCFLHYGVKESEGSLYLQEDQTGIYIIRLRNADSVHFTTLHFNLWYSTGGQRIQFYINQIWYSNT